jgi:4-hydroxythreonine-4-phosphate dehydrogenase
MFNQPRLLVTLGDPAGIGAEVVLKALAHQTVADYDLTIVGNRDLLAAAEQQLRAKVSAAKDLAPLEQLNMIDVPIAAEIRDRVQIGEGNACSGEASFQFLNTAIDLTLAGKFDGIITAPIAKSAWLAAGHNYPGQTELLAVRSGVDRFGMLFVGRSPHTQWILRTLLATTHIPLNQVSSALNPDLLSTKLELLIDCLRDDFGLTEGKIAIAGLNPHSGEQGQLGTEEIDWMIDWLASQRNLYPQYQLQGLIPPDTMWVKPGQAWFGSHPQPQAADAYLALYHDQGLIPVKLMAFDRAINTTIGLPFVRTSPDHGTAFDIAGLGIANPQSMISAIELAAELAIQRASDKHSINN